MTPPPDTPAERIARAVLYEGYILYPYRPSAIKNRHRWALVFAAHTQPESAGAPVATTRRSAVISLPPASCATTGSCEAMLRTRWPSWRGPSSC